MKKLLLVIVAFALTFSLAACNGEELPELPDEVTMANVDDYLARPDVQYVDLRNFDEKMKNGYIEGFEVIPFFDYMEATEILVRTDSNWEFAAEDLLSQSALEELFNKDKVIFLMCGSGTRAEFVLEALESLDYTVYNVGGFADYDGAYLVTGDGSYDIDVNVEGDYTPGTYYGVDPVGGYQAVVVINANGGIEEVMFDAIQGLTSKQNLGFDYGMSNRSEWEWFEHANTLAAKIVADQGWDNITLEQTAHDSTWNALTVPHHIMEFDGLAGVTIGAEGFVFAWNAAISQASTSGLGVVATDVTPEQWAAAHEPAFDYVDGVYFGMDEAHGYYVRVTIEDGFITDVFFDALYDVYLGCDVDGTFDDTIAKGDCGDVATETPVYEETTKQVLGFDYNMKLFSGKDYEWFEHANMLGEAIVEAQEWDADWVIIPGTDGGHDKFDTTDTDTVDAVGGVTIGIEGFKHAWEEAIAQAEPTS